MEFYFFPDHCRFCFYRTFNKCAVIEERWLLLRNSPPLTELAAALGKEELQVPQEPFLPELNTKTNKHFLFFVLSLKTVFLHTHTDEVIVALTVEHKCPLFESRAEKILRLTNFRHLLHLCLSVCLKLINQCNHGNHGFVHVTLGHQLVDIITRWSRLWGKSSFGAVTVERGWGCWVCSTTKHWFPWNSCFTHIYYCLHG